MSNLGKYSNIFGAVNTGVHKYRFMNIAMVDFIMTILVGLLISYYYKLGRINSVYVIVCLFILGIILHSLFKVRTTLDKILFP